MVDRFSLNPKVSVITVCFNSQQFLERSIQSVLSQSYRNIEYIIIDGGSTDRTLEIINKYRERINSFISEPDNGIYDAMNKGIKLASGEIICFLNSDDRFFDKYAVEKAVAFLRNKKVDFIYGNMLCTNLDNTEYYLKRYPLRIKKRFFLREPLGHSATFYQKESFTRAGYFDIKFKISSDYEWYLRALFKKGLRAAHLNEIISIFQEGGKSGEDGLRLSETAAVLSSYFKLREIFIGKAINFILSADFLRFIGRVVLQKKGYGYFRSLSRRLTRRKYSKYLNSQQLAI